MAHKRISNEAKGGSGEKQEMNIGIPVGASTTGWHRDEIGMTSGWHRDDIGIDAPAGVPGIN